MTEWSVPRAQITQGNVTAAVQADAAGADCGFGGTSPPFGEEALAAALAGCAGLDAAGVVARLGEILAGHSGGWASDDTALLALRVPPASGADSRDNQTARGPAAD